MNRFKKVLSLCENNGFLFPIPGGGLVPGPVGVLLSENLRTEWFRSVVTNSEQSVFYAGRSDFNRAFCTARSMCSNKLPFGVAQITNRKSVVPERAVFECSDDVEVDDFCKFFADDVQLMLTMFVAPHAATRMFQDFQRIRRMWWRKISAAPGLYSFSEMKSVDNGNQSVHIISRHQWGDQKLEEISLNMNQHPHISPENLLCKDNRKSVQACYVTSSMSLSVMFLNAICEAYEEMDFQGSNRQVLQFHRKIAPYQISFSNTAASSSISSELQQLALYLCLKFRQQNISTLLIPECFASCTLDSVWKHHDGLGVPYTVVLNENSLKSGIAHLRSRDTTLREQVHVTDLPKYATMLFKNY